jgi:uncharacterized membrane protein YqiK
LGNQLILLVVLFAAIGLWLFVSRYKDVPDVMTVVAEGEKSKKAEETIQSREFWMFLGSLVLLSPPCSSQVPLHCLFSIK